MGSSWITPKEDWIAGDGFSSTDANRIENNIDYIRNQDAELFGDKTINGLTRFIGGVVDVENEPLRIGRSGGDNRYHSFKSNTSGTLSLCYLDLYIHDTVSPTSQTRVWRATGSGGLLVGDTSDDTGQKLIVFGNTRYFKTGSTNAITYETTSSNSIIEEFKANTAGTQKDCRLGYDVVNDVFRINYGSAFTGTNNGLAINNDGSVEAKEAFTSFESLKVIKNGSDTEAQGATVQIKNVAGTFQTFLQNSANDELWIFMNDGATWNVPYRFSRTGNFTSERSVQVQNEGSNTEGQGASFQIKNEDGSQQTIVQNNPDGHMDTYIFNGTSFDRLTRLKRGGGYDINTELNPTTTPTEGSWTQTNSSIIIPRGLYFIEWDAVSSSFGKIEVFIGGSWRTYAQSVTVPGCTVISDGTNMRFTAVNGSYTARYYKF